MQILDTGLDTGLGLGQSGVNIFETPFERVIPTPTKRQPIVDVFTRTTPRFDGGQGTGLVPRLDQGTRLVDDPFVPQKPPPEIFGGGLPPPITFFPSLDPLRSKKVPRKTKKKSRLGGRLFDIADEPFGEVAVGLGFFVETERGEDTIEDALGIEPEFVPITRQEREARERLGVGKKKRSRSFAEGFGLGDFFS